jgi:hypothetical protein
MVRSKSKGANMATRDSIRHISAASTQEAPIRSAEPQVDVEQLATIEHRLGELPELVAAAVEDCLSTMKEDIQGGIELVLERAFAEEDEHYSPYGLVDRLNEYRPKGYQFFCIHAEPYKDDPEVAGAEQSLFSLANSPIRPGAVKKNRQELNGWIAMVHGVFEEGALNKGDSLRKDVLLQMARYMVFCGGVEVAAEPVERMWPALDADETLRDILRATYSLGPPKETKGSASRRGPQPKSKKAIGGSSRLRNGPQSVPSTKKKRVAARASNRGAGQSVARATTDRVTRKPPRGTTK